MKMPTRSDKKSDPKKKKAVKILQKYARGWIVRSMYRAILEVSQGNKHTVFEEAQQYRKHIYEIMKRHDEDNIQVEIDLREFYDYLVKKQMYKTAFEEIADKRETIEFDELMLCFKYLHLNPTSHEIGLAAEKLSKNTQYDYNKIEYTYLDMLDIAMHIFVPRGTRLGSKRVSTWMHPIVGKDDASIVADDHTIMNNIKLSKCASFISTSINNTKHQGKTLSASNELLKQLTSHSHYATTVKPSKKKKKK